MRKLVLVVLVLCVVLFVSGCRCSCGKSHRTPWDSRVLTSDDISTL